MTRAPVAAWRGCAAWLALALVAVPALGCNASRSSDHKEKEADDSDEGGAKKKKGKKGEGSAVATSSATAATPKPDGAPSATGAAPPPETAAPPPSAPPPLAAGRSAVPTLEEWSSQLKEVNVKGSSALKCETKMIREYLRVSCKDKNDSGGTPTSVAVVKGGRDAWTFASGGAASLVIPYLEGIDAEVRFSWTDKSHLLKLQWPKGSPKPAMLGVFEGASSPQDGVMANSADGEARLCACHKKLFKTSCDQMFAGYNPFCDADFKSDCQRLLECSRGEPSAMPSCPAGTERGGTGHWCYKRCTSAADCAKGQTCDTSSTGQGKVCWDP